jgi:tRNA (cmo5U34)-methyltransferase
MESSHEGHPHQFHFNPDTYLATARAEVPAYDELQDAAVAATVDLAVDRILELGVGTGETSRRIMRAHPGAKLVGIDESSRMLAAAADHLDRADLRVARLEDPLPPGTFDVVVTALTVHHLDAAGKADLFRRVAERLTHRGRFVIADVVVPEDPRDALTPVDGVYDKPSTLADQLGWLADTGFTTRVTWERGDLAVVSAELV